METAVRKRSVVIPAPVELVDAEVSCKDTPLLDSSEVEEKDVVRPKLRRQGKVEVKRAFPARKHGVFLQNTPSSDKITLDLTKISPIAKELHSHLHSSSRPSLFHSPPPPLSSDFTQTQSFPSFRDTYRPLSSQRAHLFRRKTGVISPSQQVLQTTKSELSVMDYFTLLSKRPGNGRRTPHTHQKRAASKGGYRTKLQKDPILQRSPLGVYRYADCYERDEPFLRKMFLSARIHSQHK